MVRLFTALRISRAPVAALMAIGIVWGGFSAFLPAIKARIGVGDGLLGLFLLVGAIGAIAAMALAPRVEARLGARALPVAAGLLVLCVAPVGVSGGVWSFAAVILAIGIGTGLLDILANARVSQLEARHDLTLMNLNHACYSFAYAGAALLTGLAREAAWPASAFFLLVAGAVAGLCVAMTGPAPAAPGPAASGPAPRLGPVALLAGIVTLVAFFAENATEGWSALHIERTLGGGAAQGALGPAMLGLTMGLGRIAGHLVTIRGGELAVLRGAALVAGAGLALAALAPVPLAAYLGFGLLGLGVSVVAPLALAISGQSAAPELRTRAVSRTAMIGYAGFFVGPPLMGLLSEAAGLRAAFAIAALMLLAIPLVLLPRLKRHLPG